MSKYIKPPSSRTCKWRTGAPPSIGWWPASISRDTRMIRWWDGVNWSQFADDVSTSEEAAVRANKPWGPAHAGRGFAIRWTDRWWPNNRAASGRQT